MKHPASIILNALLQNSDQELTDIIPNTTISLKRTESNTPMLCMKLHNVTKNEITWAPIEISFNNFIQYCEKLTQDKLTIISANTTLNKIKSIP